MTGLAYDILSFVPGEDNDIAVNVANTGTTELTQVKVTISDASGNVLHEEVVSARMKPGEVLEKHLSVRIPKELAAGNTGTGNKCGRSGDHFRRCGYGLYHKSFGQPCRTNKTGSERWG